MESIDRSRTHRIIALTLFSVLLSVVATVVTVCLLKRRNNETEVEYF